MTTRLVFQGPGAETSLLTTLLGDLESASGGGGIFAWTNRAGIAALLGSTQFTVFTRSADFDLVVGTDLITDEAALDDLITVSQALPGLKVSVFVHDQPQIFHPKLAWLTHGADSLRLIVGSGNLTRGGLQANWEAFSTSDLQGCDASAVLTAIGDWRQQNAAYLLTLDDPAVRTAVRHNVGNERVLRQRRRGTATDSLLDASEVSQPAEGDAVLVAEIPKNRRDREGRSLFSQANFDRFTFETYFGIVGAAQQVLLQHVNAEAELGDLESRFGKYKPASRNYYFELAAAAGTPHSGTRPPIGLFLRLQTGSYLYLYRLPDTDGYDELDSLLTSLWIARGNQGRRVITSRSILMQYWPEAPVLHAPEPSL